MAVCQKVTMLLNAGDRDESTNCDEPVLSSVMHGDLSASSPVLSRQQQKMNTKVVKYGAKLCRNNRGGDTTPSQYVKPTWQGCDAEKRSCIITLSLKSKKLCDAACLTVCDVYSSCRKQTATMRCSTRVMKSLQKKRKLATRRHFCKTRQTC